MTQIGRYRVIRCIGRGGMGDVHLARFEAMPGVRRLAALKVLRLDPGATSLHEKMLHEARLSAHVTHPNVVGVHELGFEAGEPFIVMELVKGHSLSELIAEGPMGLGWVTVLGVDPESTAAVQSKAVTAWSMWPGRCRPTPPSWPSLKSSSCPS